MDLTWEMYIDWLVAGHGSLTAVADALAAERHHTEDVGTIERGLRRLRARVGEGGKWGARAVRRFGLPEDIDQRLRWMGAYHSRFTDLPVGVCEDLVRVWDRPPVTDAPGARAWLGLAQVGLAFRRKQLAEGAERLAALRIGAEVEPRARVEASLAAAFVASRRSRADVPARLLAVERALDDVADGPDRSCLVARWVDHHGYQLNHAGDHAGAEAYYLRIPEVGPPFALARRSNGLAFCRWKLGRVDEAVELALAAARHAGDGGHVRLRSMALSMVARIDPTRTDAAARARAIAVALDDEVLRQRFGA